MNSKNEGLVERGFDVAVYEYVQGNGINPKVILATLAQKQGWCRNGNYNSAFGVGPGGNPIDFAEGEIGRLYTSVNTFIEWYEHGKSLLENGGIGPNVCKL